MRLVGIRIHYQNDQFAYDTMHEIARKQNPGVATSTEVGRNADTIAVWVCGTQRSGKSQEKAAFQILKGLIFCMYALHILSTSGLGDIFVHQDLQSLWKCDGFLYFQYLLFLLIEARANHQDRIYPHPLGDRN